MKNPIFYLLTQYQRLFPQWDLNKKTFKDSSADYLLLNLPVPPLRTIKAFNSEMILKDHHLNFTQLIKNNEKSQYHYTMFFTGGARTYKTHVNFNAKDNMTIEPVIFELVDNVFIKSNNSFQPEEIMQIMHMCMSSITPYIAELRARQQTLIKALRLKSNKIELELTALSKDFSKNKDAYLKLVEAQIPNLEELIAIGTPYVSRELRFYKNVLAALSLAKSTPLSLPATVAQAEELGSIEEQIFFFPSARPKTAAKVSLPAPTLLERINVLLEAPANNTNDLAKSLSNMMDSLDDCLALEIDHTEARLPLEIMTGQINLKQAIRSQMVQLDLMKNWNVYARALHQELVEINLPCLKQILETDDAEKLKLILSPSLAEMHRFILSENRSLNYTLIEWGTHFKAIKCVEILLENGFSLDYLPDSNSPLSKTSAHAHFFGKLLHFLNSKNLFSVVERLFYRIIATQEDALRNIDLSTPQGKQKARLLELTIEQVKVKNRIYNFYKNNRLIQATILQGKEEEMLCNQIDSTRHPKLYALFNEDPQMLSLHIEFNKVFLTLLSVLKPNHYCILDKAMGENMLDYLDLLEMTDPKKCKDYLLNYVTLQIRSLSAIKDIIASKLPFKFSKHSGITIQYHNHNQAKQSKFLIDNLNKISEELEQLINEAKIWLKEELKDPSIERLAIKMAFRNDLKQELRKKSLVLEHTPEVEKASEFMQSIFSIFAESISKAQSDPELTLPPEEAQGMQGMQTAFELMAVAMKAQRDVLTESSTPNKANRRKP